MMSRTLDIKASQFLIHLEVDHGVTALKGHTLIYIVSKTECTSKCISAVAVSMFQIKVP